MRQKLITLCPNSFELAQKMPNFSRWVRRQLLESIEKSESEQSPFEDKALLVFKRGVCWCHSTDNLCQMCAGRKDWCAKCFEKQVGAWTGGFDDEE